MSNRLTKEEAKLLLIAKDQPDLLKDFDSLTAGGRANLLSQLSKINWDMIDSLKRGEPSVSYRSGEITPACAIEIPEIDKKRQELTKRGEFMLRAGKIGAVMLAGGMGTRLGLNRPKGEVNIGEKRDLYIFQCLINNLKEVTDLSKGMVHLYIMTNETTRERTEEFFKRHDYFGYPKDEITFFIQGSNPCVDLKGNLFFDRPGHIATSPDGNGGWFKSMAEANLLDDLKKRGIEWLNVFSVDNVLQRIADPAFIGAVVDGGHDSGAKAVSKIDVSERVGVFCLQNGRPSVVEYYEMDDKTKALLDDNGKLLYRFGVTLNYLFSVDKLIDILETNFPIHRAKKKIPYMDEMGNTVTPEEPNGYKFETLAADIVALMDDCLCFEINRFREFAPVKNATGADSIETARKLLKENGIRL